jgi:hypothetical protein
MKNLRSSRGTACPAGTIRFQNGSSDEAKSGLFFIPE